MWSFLNWQVIVQAILQSYWSIRLFCACSNICNHSSHFFPCNYSTMILAVVQARRLPATWLHFLSWIQLRQYLIRSQIWWDEKTCGIAHPYLNPTSNLCPFETPAATLPKLTKMPREHLQRTSRMRTSRGILVNLVWLNPRGGSQIKFLGLTRIGTI